MEIYVAYCHLTVPVRVPVTATVLDLKLKMETYLGLSVDKQDVFLGPQPLRLEDENVLQNICQVRDGTTVFLRLKLQVWVKTELERYGLVVYTDNNVLAMKKRLGERYGLKVENRRLALLDPSTNGLLVLDDRTVLHTINIHLREGIEFLLL
ncbi:hypothetical protein SLE2022_392760 [Rubroshorea leprosula]